MTYEQALNKLDETFIGDFELKVILSKALEKQIPKKHHHTRVNVVNCKARESICPSCLGVIITTENEYPKHCTWCGQALDWSGVEYD